MSDLDWSKYPNFSKSEFDCKYSGKNEMQAGFMEKLQALRDDYRKPMRISSGYRDATHPIEAKKAKPGAHASGRACDVLVSGNDAYELIKLAMLHGFTRIGVNQKGNHSSRFVHLDDNPDFPSPTVWSY